MPSSESCPETETERRKLLDAYAIDVPTLKTGPLGADLETAHDRLGHLDANLTEWQEILELAATFASHCGDAYRRATEPHPPPVQRRGVQTAGCEGRPDLPREVPSALRRTRRIRNTRADDGTRTRDPHLGKVMLYQLSHVRSRPRIPRAALDASTTGMPEPACTTIRDRHRRQRDDLEIRLRNRHHDQLGNAVPASHLVVL